MTDRNKRAITRIKSFGYAFEGLFYLLRTQPNAQIHTVITLAVIGAGVLLHIERLEWLALVITIMIVFATEGLNTAIEACVDLVTADHHPIAKVAKDVAAAAVLLTAIGAVVVGLIIFLPRVWSLIYFRSY